MKRKYFHDNTFYLLILAITCLLRYPERHNVNAWFVNKFLRKKLYQLKGYNARQLRTEFPNKGWTPSSINRLLKKFRDTGTVDRWQGSDRLRSALTNENTDQVNDHLVSERCASESRGPARAHSTVREISRKAGISNLFTALYERICSLNALRGDVRKSWLRRTALLVSYFWRSFSTLSQFAAGLKFFVDEKCSLWLQ